MVAYHHVVSLGSSFAAGPGIEPICNIPAKRSERNYAALLAKRLQARHTDLSVSGATLLHLLSDSQTCMGTVFDPQIDHLPADADLVTITCGGNDIGYIGKTNRAVQSQTYFGQIINYTKSFSLPNHASEDELVRRYQAVVRAVRAKAPHAKILLVEYLTLLGPDVKNDSTFLMSSGDLVSCRLVEKELRRGYLKAAEVDDNCEVVHIGELSEEHGIGSNDPWVNGCTWAMKWRGESTLHPNERGMQAVAEILHKHLVE
jgi:lysophospholipase L1-like esterase